MDEDCVEHYLTLTHAPTNAVSPRNVSSSNQRDGFSQLFSHPFTLISGNNSNLLKHWLAIGSYLWKHIMNYRAVKNTVHLTATESFNIKSLNEMISNKDLSRNLLNFDDRYNEIQAKYSKPYKVPREARNYRVLDKDKTTGTFIHDNRSRKPTPKQDTRDTNTKPSELAISDTQKWESLKNATSPFNAQEIEISKRTTQELFSHLPWSDNNSATSLLTADKKVNTQTSDQKRQSGDLLKFDPDSSAIFVSVNKSRKWIPESSKISGHIETKKITLENLNGLGFNDSYSPLSSVKRFRRQVGNESAGLELPNRPGAPPPLRQQSKTSVSVKAPLTYVKRKILSMMLQSLYSAQERLWPLASIMKKYDHLAPYRMAFVFMKLDQLVYEGHSIMMYLDRKQGENQTLTMTQQLQMYAQLMRRNVDVTYLVDYILQRVPRDQMVRIRQWVIRNEQQAILEKKIAYDKTYATYYIGRPEA